MTNIHTSFLRTTACGTLFTSLTTGTLVKVDNVAVIEGTEIYNSIIVHTRNESRQEILRAYEDLNRSVEK